EIVPIVVIDRSQMLGAEAGRKKTVIAMVRFPDSLVDDPLSAALERRKFGLAGQLARELGVAAEYPQHLSVRIPLPFLREKVAGPVLPREEPVESSAYQIVITEREKRVRYEDRV